MIIFSFKTCTLKFFRSQNKGINVKKLTVHVNHKGILSLPGLLGSSVLSKEKEL